MRPEGWLYGRRDKMRMGSCFGIIMVYLLCLWLDDEKNIVMMRVYVLFVYEFEILLSFVEKKDLFICKNIFLSSLFP